MALQDDPEIIHYIETIWVEDQDGRLLSMRHLSPAEPSPASLIFEVPQGTTSVRAFEYCNSFSLFQKHTCFFHYFPWFSLIFGEDISVWQLFFSLAAFFAVTLRQSPRPVSWSCCFGAFGQHEVGR